MAMGFQGGRIIRMPTEHYKDGQRFRIMKVTSSMGTNQIWLDADSERAKEVEGSLRKSMASPDCVFRYAPEGDERSAEFIVRGKAIDGLQFETVTVKVSGP
jgi:hypothetical protein